MQGFLDRGNDVVLQGYDKIHFRILVSFSLKNAPPLTFIDASFLLQWPGYEHVDWMRTITVTPSMTKAQLAAQVTKNFMNYLEVCSPISSIVVDPCSNAHVSPLIL